MATGAVVVGASLSALTPVGAQSGSGGVTIETLVNGQPADSAPGPSVDAGQSLTIDYVITVQSSDQLYDIAVRDNAGGSPSCDTNADGGPDGFFVHPGPLTAGAIFTCTSTITAAEVNGTVAIMGTVEAKDFDGVAEYRAQDAAHYTVKLTPPPTAAQTVETSTTDPSTTQPSGESSEPPLSASSSTDSSVASSTASSSDSSSTSSSSTAPATTASSARTSSSGATNGNTDSADTDDGDTATSDLGSDTEADTDGTADDRPRLVQREPRTRDETNSPPGPAVASVKVEIILDSPHDFDDSAETGAIPRVPAENEDDLQWRYLIINDGTVQLDDLKITVDQSMGVGLLSTVQALDCERWDTLSLPPKRSVVCSGSTPAPLTPGDLTVTATVRAIAVGDNLDSGVTERPGSEATFTVTIEGTDGFAFADGSPLLIGFGIAFALLAGASLVLWKLSGKSDPDHELP